MYEFRCLLYRLGIKQNENQELYFSVKRASASMRTQVKAALCAPHAIRAGKVNQIPT